MRKRPSLNLTTALGLIILIQGVALGLKALDDQQKLRAGKQAETHREALAFSEHLSGKIETVAQTLQIGYQAGWSSSQVQRAYSEIETVATLADALTAPTESRLRVNGERASELLATGQQAGLSTNDDLIVVYDPDSGSSRLAITPVANLLPVPEGGRTARIISDRQSGAELISSNQVRACSPVSSSALSVCITRPFAVMSQSAMIDLLVYALLLLGPSLAILGLFRLFEQNRLVSEAFEGEATRAGRILKTVLHQSKAGFWSWDDKTATYQFSEEASQLLGAEGELQLSKREFLRFVHQDHADAVEQALDGLPERGFVQQVFTTPDQSIWLDLRAQPDETSGALNGILHDVTETKRALARTRQAETRLKSALEGYSGPFALWDGRKRLIYWNRAFQRVFGLEPTVRAGMGYETIMLAQAANVIDRRPSDANDPADIIKTRDGAWFKIIERASPSGGMITIGMDVSSDMRNEVELTKQQARLRKLVAELERSETMTADLTRQLEEEKVNAERSSNSKNAFLANMSHELRTPLNAINGFSEILVDEMYGPLGDERYKTYAQDILDSGKHLLEMITDILDMAKIEAGKMTVDLQSIDIVDPVDAAIRMIRRKAEDKNISLQMVANPGLPLVEADHRAIRQMILNLVSNALKFTDPGGEVRVTVDQKGDELRVSVRDNGIGIPADALPRLAQPFEQVSDTRDRNFDGTGLGLALTKSFAEMHGGRLTIASKPGRGTQVSFYLPISEARSEAEPSVA
jgi:two-component system cell cycle sensor histidine kinase PleC